MGTTMTHTARAELTNVVRWPYRAAIGAEKRRILDEFIAVAGYHHKPAIRALNAEPNTKRRQIRVRPSLYEEAVRVALIVLWEASDRVCGKRLRALLPILLPAMERKGHLHLREPMRPKILTMSASMIDRLLRVPPSATRLKKPRRAAPEPAAELLTEFQARYPGFYSASHLRTLRRRLQVWRRQTIQRLICEMQDFTQDVGSGAAA